MARIRRVAETALAGYDIEPSWVRLIDHEYHTTFRIDTVDGRRFAMRVNVNSQKAAEPLDAELAWLAVLARDTEIRVPAPYPARSRVPARRWPGGCHDS